MRPLYIYESQSGQSSIQIRITKRDICPPTRVQHATCPTCPEVPLGCRRKDTSHFLHSEVLIHVHTTMYKGLIVKVQWWQSNINVVPHSIVSTVNTLFSTQLQHVMMSNTYLSHCDPSCHMMLHRDKRAHPHRAERASSTSGVALLVAARSSFPTATASPPPPACVCGWSVAA